jgi:Kdo2-lipid IVA lauroyltransferase/acyltransferase
MKSSREVRHAIEYAAVRGALSVAGSLPSSVTHPIGASAGWLAYALGIRRDVSVDNIRRALHVPESEAKRIARRSYQNLGRGMMDFAAFGRWSRGELLAKVTVDGVENLAAAREAGRGAVIVAGHFGSWEFGGVIIPALGFPASVIVGEQTNARVDDVMNELRRVHNLGIITKTSALKKALTTLRNNEFVALLADQDARKGGVMVDFLGRPASTVRGPALFAIRARCPIIPLTVHREGNRHRAIFAAPLWADPAQDEEAAVLALTRYYTDELSRRIREYPDQYFWPHRRWKTGTAQVAKEQAVAVES